MDYYTTNDVCSLFKVSHQTVKNWAKEFASYLSVSAQPASGGKRLFILEDLRVFSLVHDYGRRGFTYEDAHVALKSGQVGEIPGAASAIMPTSPAALASLRDRIIVLEANLERAGKERDEAQGQVRLLRELLTDERAIKDKQVRELYEELGELKAQLKRG